MCTGCSVAEQPQRLVHLLQVAVGVRVRQEDLHVARRRLALVRVRELEKRRLQHADRGGEAVLAARLRRGLQRVVQRVEADAEALADNIVGVGPVLAEAIVAYRLENGAFLSADQLLEIPGLGPKILEKNEKSLLVDGKAHKN